MLRIMILILFLSAILSSIWISIENEGNIIILQILDYHIEISIVLAIILLLICILLICLLTYFFIFLKNIPNSLKKYYKDKNDYESLILLLNGFAALSKENLSEVKNIFKKISSIEDCDQFKILKPLVSLFKAQSNYLQYKEDKSYNEELEDSYSDLLQHDEMKIIALKGLINLRIQNSRYYDALIYAEKAYSINSKLDWLVLDLIKIYTELGIYDKADNMIHKALSYKFIEEKEGNTLLSRNFFANANYAIANSDTDKAISLLEKALKTDPVYYDAILALTGLYQDNTRAIYKIIERAWEFKPCIEIARLIITKFKHETFDKKVKLIRSLIDLDPDAKEGYLALSELYIKENMLDKAKNTMNKLLELHAPDSVTSKLMASIETKSHSNYELIDSWLNKI